MQFSRILLPTFCVLLVAGCSGVPHTVSTATSPGGSSPAGPSKAIHGRVHGGQNPVSGAHVYLYGVGDTGYGGNAVSLLTAGAGQDSYGYYVLSGADGSFNISGDYTCPQTGAFSDTYIVALGGDSGSGANSAISLLAPLGNCIDAGFGSIYSVVNEVTTVATIYAARGFITGFAQVSAPTTTLAETALTNIDTSNFFTAGVANTTTNGGNGTVPRAEINTLANILAACVNSTGPSFTACTTLFDNAPTTGFSPVIPTDTATALFNIASNPGANVANLYALQGSSPPFLPDLPVAPNDFTMAITYTATTPLNSPAGLAIDAAGNVWVANSGNNTLTEFDPNGEYIRTVAAGSGGLNAPAAIAIDGSGNLWVSNSGANSISEFNSSGTAITGSPFGSTASGGLTKPQGLAVDNESHLWIANPSTNILSEFSVTNGSAVMTNGIGSASLDSPVGVAVDDNGLVWVTNSGNNTVSLWDPGLNSGAGAPYTGSPYSGGGLDSPHGVAIDSNNLAWIANTNANVVSAFAASNGAQNSSGYGSGGGLNGATFVAVDYFDNKWVVNHTGNSITELAANGSAVSPSTGFYGGSATTILSSPSGIAIDLDGDVWVTNSGNNTITEFLGVASPLVTPVAANIITGHGYGDSAVNRP